MPRRLRVVEPGEAAAKPRQLTVTQAAKDGSHRELLQALRARVAAAVQSSSCPPVALAALSRQLVLLSREIERVDARAEDDDIATAAAVPDEAWDGAV
jgi:hypothetical protein